MVRLPERALIIRRTALERLSLSKKDQAVLLEFDCPSGATAELLVYGPYFDFESLEEVGHRLTKAGLQYWDDYVDLKEDIPEWMFIAVSGAHSLSTDTL